MNENKSNKEKFGVFSNIASTYIECLLYVFEISLESIYLDNTTTRNHLKLLSNLIFK